ncbi:hypothetical protein K1W54_04820 [Micromonospora sp. CPCC 205371]|nr:hypothetical protein [Micromonospora sp. CPCC 205371]
MARSEARISVEVWEPEADFGELTSDAQWMYFFLLSQSDLAHTGALALRVRRWSRRASDLTPEDIEKRLSELEGHRYVVVDYDAEEVLIRTFIRGDKVYRQPNVLAAAREQLPLITSRRLRGALAAELRRVQQLDMSEASMAILLDMLKALGEPILDPTEIPSGTPSWNPSPEGSSESSRESSANPLGDRGVVTAVSSDSPVPDPRTPTQNLPSPDGDEPASDGLEPGDGVLFGELEPAPEPPALPHTHPTRSWAARDIDVDPKWVAFWQAYPSSRDKGHARKTWLKVLREGADADRLVEGALAYRNDPTRTREYTKHAGTWLNGECWNDYEPKDVEAEEDARPGGWWNN